MTDRLHFKAVPLWAKDNVATSVDIVIRQGAEEGPIHTTLHLDAGELRALARAAIRGLGFTQVFRPSRMRETTWVAQVEHLVQPALVVLNAVMPTPRVVKRRRRAA
jgi:hypothetical protein